MTDQPQTTELEARANAATEGPWRGVRWDEDDDCLVVTDDSTPGFYSAICEGMTQGHDDGENDARFVAHAREDIPALVAEVRRLRSLVAS